MDTCPVCGGWDLSPSASGKLICLACLQRSEWADPMQEDGAELEAAMAEREGSLAAPRTGSDNATSCFFCEAPLPAGGSYEFIEGAELCAACAALLQEES